MRVSIPAGVRLTEADENCIPGSDLDDRDFDAPGDVDGNEYLCFTDFGARVGQKISFTFTGTVTGDESPAGSVVVDGGVQDDNAKNDAAAITVSLKGGGQGGGLPITGAPTGLVALGGAMLLGVGGVAAFVFRRRRVITTL